LIERDPVLNLLAPADLETAPLAQPTKGALDHPPTSRVTQLTRHGTFFNDRFISSTTMFDVRDAVFLSHGLMHTFIIMAFVGAKMLLDLFGIGALYRDGNEQVISRPLVVFVGSGHAQGKRRAVFIDQQVNLAALLTSICGISTRFFATQRRGAGFAVDRLPFPANLTFRLVVQRHFSHHVGKDARLLPSLKRS
jgi:hypothetical protein